RKWILHVTEQQELLQESPVLQHSINQRNPYVDPLNFLQVSLLRDLRALSDQDSEEARKILRVVMLTINGVAAGLKNTG
ncbi:MAG: phosphoenolpyruvate carboxylase, partial [Anaerolineae bacterium]|nr:phosphoenolpyruvate carboxylase [Anaerolineae bacterium]